MNLGNIGYCKKPFSFPFPIYFCLVTSTCYPEVILMPRVLQCCRNTLRVLVLWGYLVLCQNNTYNNVF